MIVTVTLNPALDRTVFVPNFRAGEVNRAVSTVVDAGGKGINVAKALHELGSDSLACGLVAGQYGRQIKQYLTSVGVKYDFLDVAGETRVNIKIVDENGNHTDINERGFEVTHGEVERLKEYLARYAKKDNIIVISGSTPPNLTLEAYGELCQIASKAGHFIVDAEGDHLLEGIKAKPDYIKPNKAELAKTLGRPIVTTEDVITGARELIEKGAKNVAVSMGSEGAIFVSETRAIRAKTPAVPVKGPVGAGDVMVAGIAQSLECGNNMEDLAKFAVSAGAASVTAEGTKMASRRTVLKLFAETTIEEL